MAMNAYDHGAALSDRRHFFDQHDHGQDRNPGQVHHAAHKQQRHQQPATTDAIGAMRQAQPHRACPAGPPQAGDEGQRRAALIQAGPFQRRQLIKPRQHQQSAGNAPVAQPERRLRHQAR